MKLFGEYLIEAGLITESQLLNAVVDQIANLPTFPELILENRLLSNSDLLNVLKYQVQNKVEFKRACLAMGLWTLGLESKLQSLVDQRRKPLGELLVAEGVLTAEQLTRALQEYFSNVQIKKASQPEQMQFVIELKEHLEVLVPAHLVSTMQSQIQRLREVSSAQALQIRDDLTYEFRQLRGRFRFAQIDSLERLSQALSLTCQQASEPELTRLSQDLETHSVPLWRFIESLRNDVPTSDGLNTQSKEIELALQKLEANLRERGKK